MNLNQVFKLAIRALRKEWTYILYASDSIYSEQMLEEIDESIKLLSSWVTDDGEIDSSLLDHIKNWRNKMKVTNEGIWFEPVGSDNTDPFASQDNEIVSDEDRRVFSCPSCAGVNLTLQGRCVVCTDCGWSTCVL